MTQEVKDAGVTRKALYRALSQEGDSKLSTLSEWRAQIHIEVFERVTPERSVLGVQVSEALSGRTLTETPATAFSRTRRIV